jgi:hypothetical protein
LIYYLIANPQLQETHNEFEREIGDSTTQKKKTTQESSLSLLIKDNRQQIKTMETPLSHHVATEGVVCGTKFWTDFDAEINARISGKANKLTQIQSSGISESSVEKRSNDPSDDSEDTMESYESRSSSSGHLDVEHGSILAWRTHELIERLMADFYALFLPRWNQNTAENAKFTNRAGSGQRHSGANHTENTVSTSQASDSSTGRSFLKRTVNGRDLPSGDSEDEGQKRSKLNFTTQGGDDNLRKFACPFFKYDPRSFSKYGSCTGPGFKSVSRVKYACPSP